MNESGILVFMVIAHILISVSSVLFAMLMYVRPSRRKVAMSYTLLTGTLLSGLYLTMAGDAPIAQTCIMGLFFFVFMAVMIQLSESKLAE